MRFTLDHGHDAGGLQRHVFSEFGKGLPDLLSISAAADTLAAARALLKGWEPAMTARAHGRDEAQMLSRLCEIAAAAPALLASGNGGLLSARPAGPSISGGCAPVAPLMTPPVPPPVTPPVAPPAAPPVAPPAPARSVATALPSAKRRRTELALIAEGARIGLMQALPPILLHLPPSASHLPPSPSHLPRISVSLCTSLR